RLLSGFRRRSSDAEVGLWSSDRGPACFGGPLASRSSLAVERGEESLREAGWCNAIRPEEVPGYPGAAPECTSKAGLHHLAVCVSGAMQPNATLASGDEIKEQFFQVLLTVLFAQLRQGAARLNAAAADDGDAVAQLLDLAHDVRGEDDALAQAAQPVDVLQHR